MKKIRYIEIKPVRQIIDFDDSHQYREFIDKRLKEIIDYVYANKINYNDYFEYRRVLLNKDGSPRKEINPKWLHTKEAHKKQKEKWLKYCEKRKQMTSERSYRRKIAEIQAKIDFYKNELKLLKEEYEKTN
jgi:hypothetical protein